MDKSKKLVNTKVLKLGKLAKQIECADACRIHYDDVVDDLMVLFVSPENETVVHYIDDQMAVLYEPDTMEIVGFQVEAFELRFMKIHRKVHKAWVIDTDEAILNLGFASERIDRIREQQRRFVRELDNVARPKLQQRGLAYA